MEIINVSLVNLSVGGESKEEIIRQLAKSIQEEGRLHDYDKYVQSVFEREELSTTGIGFGIAIPHGKSEAVKETTIAFGRTTRDIDWQSLDEKPANIVFLLAVPESKKGDEHLRILASLSRKLIHEEFRNQLLTTELAEEIVQLVGSCVN